MDDSLHVNGSRFIKSRKQWKFSYFLNQKDAFFFSKFVFVSFRQSPCRHVWSEQSHRAPTLRLSHLKVSIPELVTPIVYPHQRQFGDGDALPESRPAYLCQTNKLWQPVSPRRSSLAGCSAGVLSLNCLLFTTTKIHRCVIIPIQTTLLPFFENAPSKKKIRTKKVTEIIYKRGL